MTSLPLPPCRAGDPWAPSQGKGPPWPHFMVQLSTALTASNASLHAITDRRSGTFSLIKLRAHSVTSVSLTHLASQISYPKLSASSYSCFQRHPGARTGNPAILQKFIPFLTSIRETCCRVVTMITPSIPALLRYCTIEMFSSNVPGGVSGIHHKIVDVAPVTSFRNCLMRPFLQGPFQTTASIWL